MFFSIRKSTISALVVRPRWKKNYLKPKISVSGLWLEKAGFEIGAELEIKVYKNKLIIEPKK